MDYTDHDTDYLVDLFGKLNGCIDACDTFATWEDRKDYLRHLGAVADALEARGVIVG